MTQLRMEYAESCTQTLSYEVHISKNLQGAASALSSYN